MGKIRKLKNNIINNIAAGEIIESPSSVVKDVRAREKYFGVNY